MSMKGKITKAELDALNEVLRKEYKPLLKDGQPVKDSSGNELYQLDTPDMEHVDDVKGLKSALENERAQNTERGQKISALEADKTRLEGEVDSLKNKKPEKDPSAFEDERKQLIEKHTGEMNAERQKAERYRSALDKTMRIDAARAAISGPGKDSKRTRGEPDLLLPLVLERTRFVENPDGSFKIEVINDKGQARIGDSQGNPMTLDQLLDEMFEDPRYGRAFEPATGSGSGAPANRGGGAGQRTINRAGFEAMNPKDRSTFIKEGGQITD